MLTSQSGGLQYHLQAQFYASFFWKSYKKNLNTWLCSSRLLQKDSILLFGASAGYSLSPHFIGAFKNVVLIDVDPLCHIFFAKRFKPASLEHCHENFFTPQQVERGLPALQAFLTTRKSSALLFCNILGQLRYEFDPESKLFSDLKKALAKVIRGHPNVASYHDRVSGGIKPKIEKYAANHRLSDQEIINAFYDSPPSGSLLDHLTDDFFSSELNYNYFLWRFKPSFWHLIEAVESSQEEARS